ncbi:MAG: hypothetical protein LRY51_00905 [Geovibrio sp.]|nr:hypothetical protein [Geovibrio sp.]
MNGDLGERELDGNQGTDLQNGTRCHSSIPVQGPGKGIKAGNFRLIHHRRQKTADP